MKREWYVFKLGKREDATKPFFAHDPQQGPRPALARRLARNTQRAREQKDQSSP